MDLSVTYNRCLKETMMKRIMPLIVSIMIALFPVPALAGQQLPYLISAFIKTFHSAENYPGKEVEVTVTVLTRSDVEPSDRKGSILYALKFHDMLCDAFIRRGWRVTHPITEKLDAGTLELTFEPRMKRVVMKTFIYPCDKDPLWNMMKYRGGSYHKYFDKVANKAQDCIKTKNKLR